MLRLINQLPLKSKQKTYPINIDIIINIQIYHLHMSGPTDTSLSSLNPDRFLLSPVFSLHQLSHSITKGVCGRYRRGSKTRTVPEPQIRPHHNGALSNVMDNFWTKLERKIWMRQTSHLYSLGGLGRVTCVEVQCGLVFR